MRHPTYLLRSRHHIFYFRWPLPSLFRQHGKTIHIKISLQTREPKEALRLSTVLLDHVNYLMKQDWILTMDYIEIKAMVEAHFAQILEERKQEIDKHGPLLDNDMKYWGVLIAFYTGARLNEIASLMPKDIKQDKKTGIRYFDINDEEEMKRLKTNAATRRVPVHSELIRLGLLDYIEKICKEGKEDVRLLPELCGQGRIETFLACGQKTIPALIIDASEEQALIMSLVENLARRKHRANELLQGIEILRKQG